MKVERLVIIGSCPAGLTAAIYAARADCQPLVFEGFSAGGLIPGGQRMCTTEVENSPGVPQGVLGPKLMKPMREQAARFGARFITEDVVAVNFRERPFYIKGDETEAWAHTVIVATGARANWLDLPNEQRLAKSGGGVSACAVCDGALPMYRDQEVLVVGVGDSAIEEGSYLTKFASKVHIIHRRGALRASKIMQKRALNNPKINVLWHKVVTDVLGEQMITGVKLRDTRTGEETVKELGGLFIAIGHTPTTAFLEGQLELTEKGYIKLKDAYRTTTSVEGVFAAGDVADSVYRQAITAAGMGCKAAIDAERWLAEHGID